MTSSKLLPGSKFPKINITLSDKGDFVLGDELNKDASWQMIVIYRGAHCPMCTKFLNELEEYKYLFLDVGIEVVALSADRKEQLQAHQKELNIGFDIGYGLSLEAMDKLGIYQSVPRNEHETDHVFAEPALFIVDRDLTIQLIDISNNPFARPEIIKLYEGLKWIRDPENQYPIRGTHSEPIEAN